MFAIEKPKQPKVIKYVWWDGFNKEEVEEVFPNVLFSKYTVHDEDPCQATICIGGNRIWNIDGGVYLCCELGHPDTDIFTLSKKKFEEFYYTIPKE